MRFDEHAAAAWRPARACDRWFWSNDTQNTFEAMRLAGLANRNDRDYKDWPSPQRLLCAATSCGAHALGLGAKAVGMIETGRFADLISAMAPPHPLCAARQRHQSNRLL